MAIIQRTMSEAIRCTTKMFRCVSPLRIGSSRDRSRLAIDLLPKTPALALDVGAGTGRDVVGSLHAAWKWSQPSRPPPCAPKRTAASFAVDPMVSDSLSGLEVSPGSIL
jgi:hypothetical protein